MKRFVQVAGASLWRVTHSNFQHLKADDAEREALVRHGVVDPLAQDYAAWRRALMYLGAVSMVVWSVVSVVSARSMEDRIRSGPHQGTTLLGAGTADREIDLLGAHNLAVMDTLDLLVNIAVLVGTVLVLLGAFSWADVRRSRRWMRLAFCVVFITPFAMAAIPFTAFMDFGHLAPSQKGGVTLLLGTLAGVRVLLLVAPRALTLLPASIRASMTLKTLIPESPLPGWVTTLFAPTYPAFLIVVITLINQIHGSFLLLAGMACLILAPLVYLRYGRRILRPNQPEEVDTFVVVARHRALYLNILGGVLISIFVLRLDYFSIGDALRLLVGSASNFLLVTVFTSDLMLAFMYVSHRQTNVYEETDLARSASEKFAGLAEVGLTDLRAARPPKRKA